MARQAETSLPDAFFDTVDRASATPIYQQVSRRLEAAISSGELPAGTRLENEVAMAEKLGLSRPTVRQAIQELVDKGLVVRRRGIGTQVVQRPVARRVELTSLYDDLAKSGNNPRTEVITHDVRPASAEAALHLSVHPGSPVLFIERVRYAGGIPLAVLRNMLPQSLSDITAEDLAEHGLYDLLRARGRVFSVAQQTIGARSADAHEAHLLGVETRSPLLTMDRATFDNNGAVIEWGRHCYRPDRYSFETTLVSR